MARDPALKPYRLSVYAVYGLFCAVLFVQLFRSVIGDLYGRPVLPDAASARSATACLVDVQGLYDQLSARANQPAPSGFDSDQLALDWDIWTRRWEADVQRVVVRCGLKAPSDPIMGSLASALDGIEELRRRLSRSGEDAAKETRRVKESLADARRQLGLR